MIAGHKHAAPLALDALQAEVDALKPLQAESSRSLHPPLDALLPAIFDRAFKGEL